MRSMTVVVVAALGVSGVLAARPAAAQVVRYELDSADALLADGFIQHESSPAMTFSGGQLHIQTMVGYSELILRSDLAPQPAPTTGFLVAGSSQRGYRVEVRMQLLSRDCAANDGPGVWIGDGFAWYRLHILEDSVQLGESLDAVAPASTTDAMHVYRIESPRMGFARLFIDDVMVLETEVGLAASQPMLNFGDLGGCDAAESLWDYIEYDTFGADGMPSDEDGDDIDDSEDDCVLVANFGQADGDGDGVGDACDACPEDPDNDADRDHVCAPEDLCPNDPRNDQDGNGLCDMQECAPFENGIPSAPGQCPVYCHCVQPLDQFLDPIPQAGSGSGTGGAGGGSGAQGSGNLPSAGAGAAGMGSGGAGGPTGAASPSGGAAPGTGDAGSSGSCSCSMPGARRNPACFALAALPLALAGLRRRRGRAASG